jgi:outer membrane lipoprotein-sorting protein
MLFTLATSARAQLVESPGAAESLLKRMEAAYTALASYSDVTAVKYRNPDGSDRSTVEFKMWFARPARFRADAQTTRPDGSAPKREVMWTDGQSARSWSTGKAVTNLTKVQLAGSGMFGTYAYHIPTLLEPSYAGKKRLHELGSPTLAGEEAIDGIECYRVRGQFFTDPYELWIAKRDLLVRKLVASYAGHQMEEIHRNVEVNAPLAGDVFKFAPENEATVPPPATPSPTPASIKKAGR